MLRDLKRLNRYERRILEIAKMGGKLVRLRQYGYSSKTENGFRFPIHVIEIGKPKALQKNPAGLIAGVHGLETIGIRVLLDFLEHIFLDKTKEIKNELEAGKFGIACIPILNPGGVAGKSRSNPRGVDLMRNSGVEAVKAPFFFGGHKISNKLPYYRGKRLEPESRVLDRFTREYFFEIENSIIPVIDVHSGFGTIDNVWWPYAANHDKTADDKLYNKMAEHLTKEFYHNDYKFGPQSESYTTHGDLWDRLYDIYQIEIASQNSRASRFLPLTLEIGTWTELKKNPMRILTKRGIFNPTKESKREFIVSHRRFLGDCLRLAGTKLKDWN